MKIKAASRYEMYRNLIPEEFKKCGTQIHISSKYVVSFLVYTFW